jgi:predicted Zn finger-like uncharacterized protein
VYTQCSRCETVFKLSAETLRAAGGQVRCGKCGEVFNALAHLAEDPSAFIVDETEIDLEFRADNILQSPAPMTPARDEASDPVDFGMPSDFGRPGVETARLHIDWDVSEAPSASPEESEESEEPLSEEFDDTSMEFSLPPGELDRIFVDSKKRAAGERPPGRAQPPPPRPPPHPEEIAIREAAAEKADFDSGAPRATAPNAETPGAETPSAAASGGFEVSEDVRREMLSGMTPGIGRPIKRRATPFDFGSPEPRASPAPWLIAAIASALLLIVQVIHHNRGGIAAWYSKMGAHASPASTLSAYQLRQWGVTGDPGAEGTLRVRASILNTAAQLEPYPLLRVTLANRFGGSIGTRDFEPSEYLGRPTAKLLAPGERVDATMDILDPGKNAEGFEIDVCLRGSDRKVSCANDAAPAQAKR